LNCENELNAFGPAVVAVVMPVTLPLVVTVVAVRPSGMIWVTPDGTDCAAASVG